ncbi:MAG: hypothetical protein NZ606_05080, partial [Candidatus Kapabacteria bacterium]|nr:hypothetical protein [Candidatus Kapabacteria bacterium]
LKQMDAYCRKVDENLKKVEEYQRQVEKSLKEIDRLQLKQYQIPPLPQPDWELRNDDYSSPHFLSPDNSQHLSKVYEQLRQVFEILNSAFKQLQKQLQQFR